MMDTATATKIIDEVFSAAGLEGLDVPRLTSDLSGLMTMGHWEAADLSSEGAFRAQCERWVAQTLEDYRQVEGQALPVCED